MAAQDPDGRNAAATAADAAAKIEQDHQLIVSTPQVNPVPKRNSLQHLAPAQGKTHTNRQP